MLSGAHFTKDTTQVAVISDGLRSAVASEKEHAKHDTC